jgi:TonB family protein
MKFRRRLGAIAIFAALAVPAAVRAQSTVQDSSARRVKTRVVPEYPAIARQMHLAGRVKLEVTVAPDGSIRGTKVVGGSPLLVRSALDAVKSWRYESGPRETTEVVEFNFSGTTE